jgi:hypothetical protein
LFVLFVLRWFEYISNFEFITIIIIHHLNTVSFVNFQQSIIYSRIIRDASIGSSFSFICIHKGTADGTATEFFLSRKTIKKKLESRKQYFILTSFKESKNRKFSVKIWKKCVSEQFCEFLKYQIFIKKN